MALYAVERFAASDAESGLAASSFVIGATAARFFSGYVVDRFGRRNLMLISLIGVVVACAGYFLETSLLVLVLVRILHGVSYAVANTAMMTIAQSAIPPQRRAEGTGYLALGTTLATAVGPAVGLFVVGSYGYTVLFAASLATAVLGLVLGLVVHQHPSEKAAAAELKQRAHPRFSVRSIIAPRVVPVGLFMLMIGVAYSGVLTFFDVVLGRTGAQCRGGVLLPGLRLHHAGDALRTRADPGPAWRRRDDLPGGGQLCGSAGTPGVGCALL